MNRILGCLFILFCAEIAAAQRTYKAEYYSKSTPNIAIQITYDSSSDDEKDTTGFSDFIKNAIGIIESRIYLSANNKTCEIEVVPIQSAQMNGVTYNGAKYQWNQEGLLIYKSDSGKFVPANKKTISLTYTGATKRILGYDCKEARSADTDRVEVTAWICEKLPSFINPAIPIKGVKGAVLEYREKNQKQISLIKLDAL